MKKWLAFVLAACLVLGLTACTPHVEENSSSGSSSVASESGSHTEESQPEKTPLDILREQFPTLDGSTSLIPLEAGVRAALFGVSQEEATKQVAHSTTWGSFYNLLDEKADLIFTVPLSEEQLSITAERGMELEQVPVAREGFVFVVNAKNPVRSLTQEQIRKIYSGEITNWKEVGGEDAEIVAYQRNNDSGSQNYMISFMGDTPLMDAPTEKRPASMSGLMDVIAVNDYAEQSIGYSVYAYAADMYGNGDEIRFIEVDGVAPSKETMASGAYPLLSDNYAIFRADEPEDSPVRTLCDWMTSDEGQRAIAEAGYVTIRDVGFDYAAYENPFFRAVGTAEAWETPHWTSKAVNAEYGQEELPLQITLGDQVVFRRDNEELLYSKGITYTLDCLTDKTLEQKINDWIASSVAEADRRADDMAAFIDNTNATYNTEYDNFDSWWAYWEGDAEHEDGNYAPSCNVYVKAKNGYIWAVVSMQYSRAVQDCETCYYHTESQIWDLITGEEVEISALFREGVQIDELLNQTVRTASAKPYNAFNCYIEMTGDFTELPTTGWCVTPEGVYVDSGAANFIHGVFYSFDFGDGYLASENYRNMEDSFTDAVCASVEWARSSNPIQRAYVNDELFDVELLDESFGNREIRAKINADFLSRVGKFTEAYAAEAFSAQGLDGEISFWFYNWDCVEYTDQFVVFCSSGFIECMSGDVSYTLDEGNCIWLYDLKTGERMEWSDVLATGWENEYTVEFWSDSETFSGVVDFARWNDKLDALRFDFLSDAEKPFCVLFQEWNEDGTTNELTLHFPLRALLAYEEK